MIVIKWSIKTIHYLNFTLWIEDFQTNSKCNTQDMKDTRERNVSVPGAEDYSVLPLGTGKY